MRQRYLMKRLLLILLLIEIITAEEYLLFAPIRFGPFIAELIYFYF